MLTFWNRIGNESFRGMLDEAVESADLDTLLLYAVEPWRRNELKERGRTWSPRSHKVMKGHTEAGKLATVPKPMAKRGSAGAA